MTAPKTHARLATLESEHGMLRINGTPLDRIAERVGRTPFYVYDRAAITRRIGELRAALPDRVLLHYAIKANPMPALVGHVRSFVNGFDVASANEMLVALDGGMPPGEISFAGPAKRPEEIRSAVAAGVCLNAESETEIERIHAAAEALGIPARVAVRVNPDFELKGSGMKMSGSPRQFGIDASRAPDAIRRAVELGLTFEGLHIFSGSQNLNAASIVEANEKTLALAIALADETGVALRSLNIGGGYGIPYFPGESPLDLAAVGAGLEAALASHEARLADMAVIVELGRYIVGEAGYYVCRVTDSKLSQGHRFLMADGGLHHHLANSGNFGQVLRKNYPVVIGNRMDAPAAEPATIVGPLCTPLDTVADRMALPAASAGDLVVVCQSGAYGYTASPHRFLSHPEPLEVLV